MMLARVVTASRLALLRHQDRLELRRIGHDGSMLAARVQLMMIEFMCHSLSYKQELGPYQFIVVPFLLTAGVFGTCP